MTHALSDMSAAERRPAQLILISLFVCSLGNSSIIPFMSYFIVDQLGMKPWNISLYSVITSIFIMIGNRLFGEMVDRGRPIFPLVFGASLGLVVASGVLCVMQSYWLLLVIVSPGIALASTGISTMFSLGRLYGEHLGLDLTRYNARTRMMTSFGWMFGPAASYLIAAHFGNLAVFRFVFILSLIGSATSFFTVSHDFRGPRRHIALREDGSREGWFDNKPLWLAAFVCFLFNIAHVLCSAALPLFYTEEAHLPVYAPGLSLTLKCTGEVIAILASPMVMARIGRRNALYLSTGLGLVAFAVLHETNSMAHMVVGALLEGLYFGQFAGVAVTFIQGFAKGRVGRATSLYMNSLFLGSLAANTGIGIIASLVDFRAAIAVAGGVMILAAAALYATRHADAEADA